MVPPDPSSSSTRILVVDDNQDGAEMLVELLAEKGHDARMALDAPEALRIAADFLPEIAFLDIALPAMDGYELAARLRALPGLANVHLVAVTGYGRAQDRARTQEAGFRDHLVKPIDFDAVDALLARSR